MKYLSKLTKFFEDVFNEALIRNAKQMHIGYEPSLAVIEYWSNDPKLLKERVDIDINDSIIAEVKNKLIGK